MTHPNMSKYINRREIADYATNIALAILYLIFSVYFFMRFLIIFKTTFVNFSNFKETLLIILYFLTQISWAALFLLRKKPISSDKKISSWIYGGLGTFLPLFFSFTKLRTNFILEATTIIGAIIAFYSILCLGKSAGIIPSNRGIVKHGLYAYIRHPMYLGYIILFFSFLIMSNPDIYKFILISIWIFSIYKRIILEEEFLGKYKDYLNYIKEVKFRLIPLIW